MTENPILDDVIEGHVHEEVEFPEWVSWFLYGAAAGIIVVSVVTYWKATKRAKVIADFAGGAVNRMQEDQRIRVIAESVVIQAAKDTKDKSDEDTSVQDVS